MLFDYALGTCGSVPRSSQLPSSKHRNGESSTLMMHSLSLSLSSGNSQDLPAAVLKDEANVTREFIGQAARSGRFVGQMRQLDSARIVAMVVPRSAEKIHSGERGPTMHTLPCTVTRATCDPVDPACSTHGPADPSRVTYGPNDPSSP
jgi:hypothetical protein